MEQDKNITKIYSQAAETIKNAILQGQYYAAKSVNRIQLTTYFSIGKYLSINTHKGVWGTGALKSISQLLRKLLPGLRGFSAQQLAFMRQFYEEWCFLDSNSLVSTREPYDKSLVATRDLENRKSVVETTEFQNNKEIDVFKDLQITNLKDFPVEDFFNVPFTHHCRIFGQVKDIPARYYYIHRCAEENMTVDRLKRIIAADEFSHEGKLPNNFFDKLDNRDLARKAVAMFKDEYLLDFINVEEMDERDTEDIDERVVEKQIVQNIKKFIMTFGKDFAFIGNQYHLEVYSQEFFPDLLFFNRELNALVVVELKTGKFKSGYLGQLMGYLSILDDKIRKPHENPSIGIVLCKEADKSYVEYVIKDYSKPMGVATYRTTSEMPKELREALPDIDALKELL